jgi:tetratricopeptide (TPR) repeat protein
MFDLAVREDRWAAADTLIRRKFGDKVPYDIRVLFALAGKDTAAQGGLRAEGARTAGQKGRRASDRALEAGSLLAIYLEDLNRAEEFTRFSTSPSLAAGIRAPAHRLLGDLGVAGGRWTTAKSEFATAGRLGQSDSVLVGRALAATLPFLAVPRADLEIIRTEVERWRPGSDVSAPLPESIRPLAGHLRLYLLGLLSSRLGAAADALRLASDLQILTAPPDSRALVRALARTIRADVALEAGRTNEGLTLLEGVRGEVPFELIRLPYFSEEHARYLRGRLLYQAGRDEEALRLVEVGFAGTPNELYYRAPAHLLQAEIQRRLGNRTAAAEQYSRFIGLWRACDPALRPVLDGAKAELARIVAERR